MDRAQQREKIRNIARQIMFSAKNSLIVHLRFLDYAINRLRLAEYDEYICTDGTLIQYNPFFILHCYSKDKNMVTRMYMHMVLHCTFRHFYVGPQVRGSLWDIACDAAVENILEEISQTEDYLYAEHDRQWHDLMAELKENVSSLTAERIYRYLADKSLSEEEIDRIYGVFLADDHSPWYSSAPQKKELQAQQDQDSPSDQKPPMEQPTMQEETDDEEEDDFSDQQTQGKGSSTANQDDDDNSRTQQSDDPQQDDNGQNQEKSTPDGQEEGDGPQDIDRDMQQLLDEWEEIAKHMELDLETFSKDRGSRVGDLLLNIKNVTREKYDYTAFLKKFASMGEKMMIDDDEFDYIYYTYGLTMYKNMPLIEPLEYKETNLVKEFVIAIDTSFSVHGDEVQSFLRKTYNILKATESFSSRINLHIIQCDVKVQHDEKITSQAELDKYMKDMLLYGFGGTDFRPVFEYVDKLIEEKEFTNLKGLIYFTDGYGTFPQRPPAYKTAFAFVSDDVMFDPVVPPWAIKLILDPEDIKQDKL